MGVKDANSSSSSPATATAVRVMTGGGQKQHPNTLAGVPSVGRVLVDAGANEIIRPRNSDWWNEIL
eukprot:11518662-Prorocentrum_lima.AAC.1